jgi:hypothetical protein
MGTDYSAWGKDALKFTNCVSSTTLPCSELSKFPIGYLANSFLIDFLSAYGFETEKSFVLINLFFLSLPVLFLYIIKKPKVAIIATITYIACLLFTPISSFYIYSGGLEIQAGVLIGLFLSSLILYFESKQTVKSSYVFIILYISALLFPLYKDVILITVVLSLFFSLFIYFYFIKKSKIKDSFTITTPLFLVAFFLLFSFGVSLSYNYFKYQNLAPLAYIHEASISSPTKIKSFEFLIASFFSPNGGILAFWFSSFIVCYLLNHINKQSFSILTLLTSAFLFTGTVIGLSLWWAPFGWDSWGNRLMVPTMLGILIALITTANSQNSLNTGICTSTPKATKNHIHTYKFTIKLMTMLVFIFSLHYVLVSYYSDKSKLLRESLLNHPSCLEMMEVLKSGGQDQGYAFWRSNYYYTCARDRFLHIPTFWKQF